MIPKSVRPFLWSSDIRKIDLEKNRERIILNILNIGSRRATDWLFATYPKRAIKGVIRNHGGKGELSPKSLNYWTLVLDIPPSELKRGRF